MPKKEAVVFDLNKTLRHKSGKPHKKTLKKAKKSKDEVIVMSSQRGGREEEKEWLNKHGLDNAKLMTRPASAHEHDDIVKERMLKKVSRQFEVKKAYDDKETNVEMFEKHGVKAKKV